MKNMSYIKNLTLDMHGKRVSCTIKGTFTNDAMIMFHGGQYYLLHNTMYNGDPYPGDWKGYKKSWGMNNGTQKKLISSNILVEHIKLLDESPEIY